MNHIELWSGTEGFIFMKKNQDKNLRALECNATYWDLGGSIIKAKGVVLSKNTSSRQLALHSREMILFLTRQYLCYLPQLAEYWRGDILMIR